MLHRVQHHVASGVDRLFGSAVLRRPPRGARAPADPREAIDRLTALRDTLREDAIRTGPADAFFPAPPLPAVERRHLRDLGAAGEVADLRWPSTLLPYFEATAARFEGSPANRWARARHFRGGARPRRTAVLVHGYMGGHLALEERLWRVGAFLARGFDVVVAVLPFHGPRRARQAGRPAFPSRDPRVTIDAFRQAVVDLQGLVTYLLAAGAPEVGAFGMSLGGYTAALLATVDPRLAFVVPVTPLASIPDFLYEGASLPGTAAEQHALHALLEEVHAVVSPLARPVLVPRGGRLVIAGEADRITPLTHARRLAEHFEAPIELFHGGHLLQSGRPLALERAFTLIDRAGSA